MMSSASGQVISPLVYKAIDYDPIRSFAPIALVAEGSIILVINPSLLWRTVAELVAAAKTAPGRLNYGSAGSGTVPHLSGELFKSAAGIDLVHVPYRGGALSIADVIGGNVQMTFEASSPLLPQIRDGRLRALTVLSRSRLPDLPDVPTALESGYPDLVVTTWTGLFAPAGTDPAIVRKLNGAINEALGSAELRAALAKVGNVPIGGPPDALAQTGRRGTAEMGADRARSQSQGGMMRGRYAPSGVSLTAAPGTATRRRRSERCRTIGRAASPATTA